MTEYTQWDKIWFDGTPVNGVQATGTLTFSGTADSGETVLIGTETYEFDSGDGVTAGNIVVDISV